MDIPVRCSLLEGLTRREVAHQVAIDKALKEAAQEKDRRELVLTTLKAVAESSPDGSTVRSHFVDFEAAQEHLITKRLESGRDPFSDDVSLTGIDTGGPVVWARIHEIAPYPAIVGCGGFLFSDIEQGVCGDCWVLASLAILCGQAPEAFDSVVLATDIDKENGWYGFRFWVDDHWKWVTVDDRLPCSKDSFIDWETKVRFAGTPDPSSGKFYSPIFAKVHKSI